MENEFNNELTHEELLIKIIKGEVLTSKEESRLNEWVVANEQNRKILNDIISLSIEMDALDVVSTIDADQAFQRVSNKIRKNSIKLWIGRVQKFAAILTIPLILAVTFMVCDDVRENNKESVAQMLEFRTNSGMTGKVMLPDGSTAILNSGSVLRYPSRFAKGEIRSVSFEGEAYFDIVKDEHCPFVIATSSEEKIKVYGTTFNLDAYPGKNVTTTLVDGIVGFLYSDKRGDSHEIILSPNHKLEFNPTCKVLSVKETTCLPETSWKDGKVILDKTPLTDILTSISKRYNVDFKISNPELATITFSGGTMTMNSLEHTLKSLNIASGINWRTLPISDFESKQIIEIY